MAKSPGPKVRRITAAQLQRAQNNCNAREGIPADWDSWFPSTIPLLVPVSGTDITAGDIYAFAEARMKQQGEGEFGLLEAAQCLALLHYLGSPPPETIVTSHFG